MAYSHYGMPYIYLAIDPKAYYEGAEEIKVKIGITESMGARRRSNLKNFGVDSEPVRSYGEEYLLPFTIADNLVSIEKKMLRWLASVPTARPYLGEGSGHTEVFYINQAHIEEVRTTFHERVTKLKKSFEIFEKTLDI